MALPLEYQSNSPLHVSPVRQRAAREAAWNGIPDILIGATCAGACFWTLDAPLDSNMTALWAVIGAYGVFFLACGVLYMVGSSRLRNGSVAWHRRLIGVAWAQIAAVLAWYGFLTLNSMHVQWAIVGSILFGGLIVAGQLRLMASIKKSRADMVASH